MSEKKLIFILDLDGTIIGDCSYQCDIYNITQIQNKKNTLLNYYKPESKLIRPYFKYFILNIKKKYPLCSFYIYTASDKIWAKKEIELIEKTHNIKFNRPIFSRDDCILNSYGEYKKSINKIKNKLKNLSNENDNIIIIDNNNTFIDYYSNLLICKTYDYILYYDLWDIITNDYKNNKELYLYIIHLITNNRLCKLSKKNNNSLKQLEFIYKWNYKKIKKINKANFLYQNDNFWKKLTDYIINNNIENFNKKTIKLLYNNIYN